MSQGSSLHSTFNARFLSPEEVADIFVPTPQYLKLMQSNHSILMGPRGCGKTTLLKMISRGALKKWLKRDLDSEHRIYQVNPDFEAVYIPSDSRWVEELKSLNSYSELSDNAESLQRVFVSVSIVREWCKVFDLILESDDKILVAKKMIRDFSLSDVAPSFLDISTKVDSFATQLRGMVNLRSINAIDDFMEGVVPRSFLAGVVDCCSICCDAYQAAKNQDVTKWALCFDELEISPKWLQEELIASLRSIDQRFLLKLTWSPVLPKSLRTNPEQFEDYATIRLWYSHAPDAMRFCESLANHLVASLLPDYDGNIYSLLGKSVFSDDSVALESDIYARGSGFYNAVIDVANNDASFRRLLCSRGVDPDDPYVDSVKERDQFFRKIKPVLFLRHAFVVGKKRRSRKSATIYCGADVVFAMSEGNPRRLINIINEVISGWQKRNFSKVPAVPYSLQAQVLSGVSSQFKEFVKTSPASDHGQPTDLTLFDFVNQVATYFASRFLDGDFPLDPVGSFRVDSNVDDHIEVVIEDALEKGALIYVGSSPQDVVSRIPGSKFRITYILSPVYKMPMRNYSDVSLDTCLSKKDGEGQMSIFGD